MSDKAELIYDGKTYDLPVIEGTENEKAVDISKLRAQSGLITMDPGYKNTGATKSAITFLDGEKGILQYRGYSIEELAEKASFVEVAYLLFYGELPKTSELEAFEAKIKANQTPDPALAQIIKNFPSNAHPMAVLSSAVSAMTAFYPEVTNPNASEEEVELNMIRLFAQLPVLSAWISRSSKGLEINQPGDEDFCSNFLEMMFKGKGENYEVNKIVSDALNVLLILHAEHEQNCSTSTVRIVGSSHSSLFSSVSAGISALWGPLHGGANQAVVEMLDAIDADGGDTKRYLAKAKDKEDPFRLMGFGHRVYKNFDPRAKIIKVAADNVLNALGVKDPVLDIAKGLEEEALSDDYFKARNLYPNVDFYSGIIYKALDLDVSLFTVLFAIGRVPGWIAQWKELRDNNEPIGRPRQIFTGYTLRPLVAIENR
jgi:citrate synthase